MVHPVRLPLDLRLGVFWLRNHSARLFQLIHDQGRGARELGKVLHLRVSNNGPMELLVQPN